MFTGIIESVGIVKKIAKRDNYLVMTVEYNFIGNDLNTGDSIACDGACLTVTELFDTQLTFEISQETISKTIAGGYENGSRLNLERAVKVGDRLDGHYVTGHIDTIATIKNIREIGESVELKVNYDESFKKLIVTKGSIAINGVSLTVNEVSDSVCTINLIPYTINQTNLKNLKKNDKVNVEFDLIGKYALKAANYKNDSNISFSKLIESGW